MVQVAAGQLHSCALDDAGSVTCWGVNTSGQTTVPALAAVVQIATGNAHTCALDNAGVLSCWGNDGFGEVPQFNP